MIVKDHVPIGFPPSTGALLAVVVLEQGLEGDLGLDVRGLPAALLITGFYNGFLQRVYETRPDLLETARSIKWVTDFPFQEKLATQVMQEWRVQ